MSKESRYAVKKSVIVQAPQEKAFRVFTEKFNLWWPRSHHIGKAALKEAIIEPRQGGRWYEKGEDGSECNWGRVDTYAPYGHLLLIWQITSEWEFDPEFETEVEVRFIAETATQTRVELEHRNLERFGVKAVDMMNTFNSPTGWTGMLSDYQRVAEQK